MTLYFLLPFFWGSGLLLYLSSERQQLTEHRWFSKPLAFSALLLLSIFTLWLFRLQGFSWGATLSSLLGLIMLSVPTPVFLLNHKPQWLWPSTLVCFGFSMFCFLIFGG